jgi:hypothetical protein
MTEHNAPDPNRVFRLADALDIQRLIKDRLTLTAAVFAVFATACGSIPWLSLVKKIAQQVFSLRIDLPKFPDVLLYNYEAVRDAGIRWLRGYVEVVAVLIPASLAHYLRAAFDVLFASAVGDFLTLWVLICLATFRGTWLNRSNDQKALKTDPDGFRAGLLAAAKFHNQNGESLVKRVESGLGTNLRSTLTFFRRALSSAVRSHKVNWKNYRQWKVGAGKEHARVLLMEWFLSIFYSLLGLVIYLALSGYSRYVGA